MEKLMKEAKNSMKLGALSMGGMFAMGSMSNLSGMPSQAKTTAGVVNTGLGLANVGQLVKTSQAIIPKQKKSKKKIGW